MMSQRFLNASKKNVAKQIDDAIMYKKKKEKK
jgi:hypothetical protein